jgi:alanine dehydrogenase
MIIGVPKEIKNREYRVALTPAGAASLVKAGHQVWVEENAGEGCGFSNEQYEQAGATIVGRAEEAWRADLVVKVKEPLPEEYAYFRRDMLLFTYLHLAAQPELTRKLLYYRVTASPMKRCNCRTARCRCLRP